MTSPTSRHERIKLNGCIPAEQWNVYSRVMAQARRRKIGFALGGGTAFSYYANRWRNSKDADFYVLPSQHDAMIEVVKDAGLVDYHDDKPYDRGWIYRSHNKNGIIVDIIWQMANYRAQVDQRWLTAGGEAEIGGTRFRMIPVEELVWAKLYIFQWDRCDWSDLVNILFVRGEHLDWAHLLGRLGGDRRVLAALVEIFVWMCPGRAQRFPSSLWDALGIKPPEPGQEEVLPANVHIADSRDWFGPTLPQEPPTQ